MLLSSGERLGPYEILDPLGAGGMGEVYRARDTRLGRRVAIKISAERYSERFHREARAVAALNHPNICHLYDVGPNYLVMELVPGETLAARISSRPFSFSEALPLIRQIVDALDAAHEKGIIHRDLKPANIKITPEGAIKVLDFGLAKFAAPSPSSSGGSEAPTLTIEAATQAGAVMGTAAYMAPEQARGEAVDKRADIWAFGVVVYEMLTGKRPFRGKTLPDVLAAVLTKEPDWSIVPAQAQPLLRRCLAKDPRQRLRDIGDAIPLLEESPEIPASSGRSPAVWIIMASACLILLFAAVAFLFRSQDRATPTENLRSVIPLPDKMTSASNGDLALSPDGQQLVFAAAGADNLRHLWLRPLNAQEPRVLPGTEEGAFPFWSPDSRFIGFSATGKLKTLEIANNSLRTLCDLTDTVKFLGVNGIAWGGSWSREGVILFGTARLMRVAAEGGVATPVTALDSSRKEIAHAFPWFLPDGRHFLYTRVSDTEGNTGVFVGSTDVKPQEQSTKPLLPGHYGAVFVSSGEGSGQILYDEVETVFARPFDGGKLEYTGDPVPVADSIGSKGYFPSYQYAEFSASATGRMVYRASDRHKLQLTWFDRQGRVQGTIGEPGAITFPSLSPDGTRVAVNVTDPNRTRDIWIYDDTNHSKTRFSLSGSTLGALWSPDGTSIAYLSGFPGKVRIYKKAVNGSTSEELLYESPDVLTRGVYLLDWSSDGRYILIQLLDSKVKLQEFLVPVSG
ncbi:MAG: protein kinase, partial [Acidobacteriota bacterium]